MKKVNTKTIILIGILVIICAIEGVSYAVWQITLTQEDDNLITSSCFQVSINDKNPITLQNTIPFTDQEGKDLTPYTFTIHNECGENALYEINYEILDDTTFENDEDRFIKIMLQEEEPKLLNELDPTEKTLKEANRAYKIEEGYIKANETKEYKLRIWLDKDVTIEDDVMGKKLSSKITITARYDRGIVTSPEVELALSRCSNNIVANIKTTGNDIASYEYQIDEEEPVTEEKDTHTFENKKRGETHKVKVKITDIYGNVTEKEEEINIPDYPTLLGKKIGTDIPLVTSGDGLYEVTHCDITGTTNDEDFAIEEYRYAGSNPNNYIKFNNEDWRIIGLVNVMTDENKVEQRVKIIRNEGIGGYSWDTSSSNINEGCGINEWSESDLMKLLNPGYDTNKDKNNNEEITVNNSLYWNGQSGTCYSSRNNQTKLCDFTNKGLKTAQAYIADDITWNTGNSIRLPVQTVYLQERGLHVKCSNIKHPSGEYYYCTDEVTRKSTWRGLVALPYWSDFVWAMGGDSIDIRNTCLNMDPRLYDEKCKEINWIRKMAINDSNNTRQEIYFLSPIIDESRGDQVHLWFQDNYTNTDVDAWHYIWPSLYLKQNVSIQDTNATGSKESPYELTITE